MEKAKGLKVFSRDRKSVGRTTGGERRCQMEGCGGTRLGVRWSNGKITYPCSRGMKRFANGDMRIL